MRTQSAVKCSISVEIGSIFAIIAPVNGCPANHLQTQTTAQSNDFFVMGIFKKRSIKSLGKKKSDMPEGLWNKCPSCGAIIDEITLKQRHRGLHEV